MRREANRANRHVAAVDAHPGRLSPRRRAGQSSVARARPKVTFTIGVTGDLNSANPLAPDRHHRVLPDGLMYDGILRLGQADYALEPELLTEVPTQENGGISEDGLTWTLDLRDDARGATASRSRRRTSSGRPTSSWRTTSAPTPTATSRSRRASRSSTTTRSNGPRSSPAWSPAGPATALILPSHVWGELDAEGDRGATRTSPTR